MLSFNSHTPKLPNPLNLDLASLSGGGACPSQFFGLTHDDRDIYVRYRGGTLKVYVAKAPGEDALRDGDCIFEADIGPPFDGSISLNQFCTLFGVTINGAVPEESDPGAVGNTDFSGQTTYWRASLSLLSDETARKVVSKAWSLFPDALLVMRGMDESSTFKSLKLTTPARIKASAVWLIDGPKHLSEIRHDSNGSIYLNPNQLCISFNYSGWNVSIPKFSGFTKAAEKELGRRLYVHGEKSLPEYMKIDTDILSMTTSYPAASQTTRDALIRLGEEIEPLMPRTPLERVNLVTGEVIDQLERHMDPVVADWCKSGEDRWISVHRDRRDGPWIGVRPIAL